MSEDYHYDQMINVDSKAASAILNILQKIKGGYTYSGACSFQVCFPLRNGGELRFAMVDDDIQDKQPALNLCIDLYGLDEKGNNTTLLPCITGFGEATG